MDDDMSTVKDALQMYLDSIIAMLEKCESLEEAIETCKRLKEESN